MVLIFDLDDTLYNERSYTESGLRAVARHGHSSWGWDANESFRFMMDVLEREGRGRIFDLWLREHGGETKARVRECVRIYRWHTPRLSLYPEAASVLDRLRDAPLYIVTDGHKIVQGKKIAALNLEPLFRRIFITHRFGLRHAKPSTYCFEKIRAEENCGWADMTYIGDNPAKDFVNLNPLGVNTVRVLTGAHRDVRAAPGHEAGAVIPDLGHFEIPPLRRPA